ncbi:hypothetical protein WBG78_28430 [Chryseolinea sp. T2]|uniref:hypothetical protein n=1 Tax=Chryseolinea sp. T2 TaxID=3129255 RepID=UPI003078560D
MTGIRLSDDFQFITQRGDFLIGDTDLQDERNILYAAKGGFLESPTLGVAIETYSNSPMNKPILERIIRKEFEKDGISVTSVTVTQVDGDDFNITLLTNRNEQ